MSVFEYRDCYIPTKYPWAIDLFKRQSEFFWIPEEIPLGDDVREWRRNLTPSERETCKNIFRVFTRMDQLVMEHYTGHLLDVIQAPEITMMRAFFGGMEAMHTRAYAYLIQTLGLPDRIFLEFQQLEHMREKCEFLRNYSCGDNSPQSLIKTIACFSLFGEGILLYGSFAVLQSFQSIGLLRATAQLVKYSQRDEELHVEGAARLILAIAREQNIDLEEDMGAELRDLCKRIVTLEKEFLVEVFAGELRSISLEETKAYIEHLGFTRLKNIGVKPYNDARENPLARLDAYLHGLEYTNFFEQKPTEYSRASQADWSNAFDDYEPCLSCD